jgi:hypothetical protein
MEPNDGSFISSQSQDLSLSAGDTDEAALVEHSALLALRARAQFDGQTISQPIQSLSAGPSTPMAMLQSEHPVPTVRDNCTFSLMLYGLMSIANQHDK